MTDQERRASRMRSADDWLQQACELESQGHKVAAIGCLSLALGEEFFANHPDGNLYEMQPIRL